MGAPGCRLPPSASLPHPALGNATASLYAALGCGTGRTNPVALTLAAHACVAVWRAGSVCRVAVSSLGHTVADRGSTRALLLVRHDTVAALLARRAGASLAPGGSTAPVKVVAGH